MANGSRTKNSIVNSMMGMAAYVFVMISTMVTRVYFARYLGEELLGLNSLFTSILQILQISELGIGNAIVISLYQPVKLEDKEKIKALIMFYKKIYDHFMIILALIGIAVDLFIIPSIVEISKINITTVQIYFLLFLVGVICSYMFSYTKSIFYAEQKNRIISYINAGQKVIISILQIISIIYRKDYYLYLILLIVGYLLENLICHFWILKKHPYLKFDKITKLGSDEKTKIINLIKPIFVLRIADKVLSQSDSLIINSFIDIVTLGMYANYHTIFNACLGLFNPIGAALTSSYGNLAVNALPERKYRAFKKSYSLFHAVGLFFCLLFLAFIQDFIYLAYGGNYLLSEAFALIMTIYLYLTFVKTIYYSYQNAMGLHCLDQKQTIIQVPFNIFLSILLASILELNGIIVGTILSILIFSIGYKGKYIFEKAFDKPQKDYYKRTVSDIIRSFICVSIIFCITTIYKIEDIFGFAIKVLIMTIMTVLIIIAIYATDIDFKDSIKSLRERILK